MMVARVTCFRLPMQRIRTARSFALESAGSNIAARMAMIAITTSSSIRVNAPISLQSRRLRRVLLTSRVLQESGIEFLCIQYQDCKPSLISRKHRSFEALASRDSPRLLIFSPLLSEPATPNHAKHSPFCADHLCLKLAVINPFPGESIGPRIAPRPDP